MNAGSGTAVAAPEFLTARLILHPFASDYLRHDDYARLCELVGGPVAAATRAGLATLTSDLAVALQDADPNLARLLEDVSQRPRSGIR
jgi:hypothetical protein